MNTISRTILKPLAYLTFAAISFTSLVLVNRVIHGTIVLLTINAVALITLSYLSTRHKILWFIALGELSWKQIFLNGLFLGAISGLAYFTIFNFFSI